jgi:hypothetical protein
VIVEPADTDDEPPEPVSRFVASMITRVHKRADRYADRVAEYRSGTSSATEQNLLDELNLQVEALVAQYVPPGVRRRGDSLVFHPVYAQLADPDFSGALCALLAAEVEFRGPLRLSRTQNALLAAHYERLGWVMRHADLPRHAALAYGRAVSLYQTGDDTDAADRCGLAQARARCRALPWGARRVLGLCTDLIAGHGYRPFRMLAFISIQLLGFVAAAVATGHPYSAALVYTVLNDYVNPSGNDRYGGPLLFVLETYAGTVSLSVFFALLVRLWFRM